MDVDIRPLTLADYDAVYDLWRQCEGIGLSGADSREGIRAYLKRNPGLSFVALEEGAVVGAVLAGHDGRRGYLHHLAVNPRVRRRSLGRQLVAHCLRALHRQGIRKCHLFVMNKNEPGLAFWKSLGWELRVDLSLASRATEPGPPAA